MTVTFNDHEGLIVTSKSIQPKKVEWIVVDGSTNSAIKKKNLKLVQNLGGTLIQELDKGIFDAMNKGLSLSKSKLIMFLNGGDQLVNPYVIDEIIKSHQYYKWKWAVGQTICVNLSDKLLWYWPIPKLSSLKFKLSIRSLPHQATVYETRFLRKFKGFRIDSYYSDWILSLKLAEHCTPHISSEIWVKFLAGGVSSQQTIDYWVNECKRLRNAEKQLIAASRLVDALLQNICGLILKVDRKSHLLARPDLSKYREKSF